EEAIGPPAPRPPGEPEPEPEDALPVVPLDEHDWLQTTSGEWLKGELVVMEDEEVLFDSEELDDVSIDWEDVAALRTSRALSVITDDLVSHVGVVTLTGDALRVAGPGGVESLPRASVFRILSAHASWRDYWSGDFRAGLTARSGNTNQTDWSFGLDLDRRTPRTRLQFSASSVYSETAGQDTADNQRANASFNYYLTRRLYLIPAGFEFYRDRFQNIASRSTAYAGVGYTLVDLPDAELNAGTGLGYRSLRFFSAPPGEEESSGQWTAMLGTDLDVELSSRTDLLLTYLATIGLEDVSETNQSLRLGLSVDLWRDFDLDVDFYFDRVGAPQADENGVVPDSNDYRFVVSIEIEF
ncbi:MAG TPA: DUF481 domain-containing protein, partial [Planctomycetota bacterium]|nr:DUF481 domain-containing protein [Planctomycetota bacterium]